MVDYSPLEFYVVTWERLLEMFRYKSVPLFEREQLALYFLSLKQKIEIVTQIIMMFHKKDLFSPKHVSSQREHVSREYPEEGYPRVRGKHLVSDIG